MSPKRSTPPRAASPKPGESGPGAASGQTDPGPSQSSIKHLKTLDSRCEAIAQDYSRKFKASVLRWRIEGNDLIILFMDGRKFYFTMPPGWSC